MISNSNCFQWAGVAFVPASVLSLRTVGATTGLVVDLGASGARVNSVVDVEELQSKINFIGRSYC